MSSGRLLQLAEKYRRLQGVPSSTAQAAATAIKPLAASGFSGGHDAYGTPWAPLASGEPAHLRESGGYELSLQVNAEKGVGVSYIEISTNNAANLHAKESIQHPPGSHLEKRAHRGGAAKRSPMRGAGAPWTHPARPLLPIEGQELPKTWKEAIGQSFANEMKKAAGG